MDGLSNVLIIYLAVVIIWLIVAVFTLVSIINKKTMSTPYKIFWCAIILAAPILGLVIYLVYNYNRERRV